MLRILMTLTLLAPVAIVTNAADYVEPTAVDIGRAKSELSEALQAADELRGADSFLKGLERDRESLRFDGPLPGLGVNIPFTSKSPRAAFDAAQAAGTQVRAAGAENSQPKVVVLVSLSMPETQIRALIQEARDYGGLVAVRGLRGGNLLDTVNHIRELAGDGGDGIVIDPNLFRMFSVTTVPTFILPLVPIRQCTDTSCEIPAHSKATGSATIRYFLDMVSRLGNGAEKEIAQSVLQAKG